MPPRVRDFSYGALRTAGADVRRGPLDQRDGAVPILGALDLERADHVDKPSASVSCFRRTT